MLNRDSSMSNSVTVFTIDGLFQKKRSANQEGSSLLTDLKAGDQVTFILEDSSGIVMIVETKKSY